ncbi:MAG: MaoC family dehydratase N-terminal domain-containing protein [Deltaproteobacteria bacterium]|nr:MaoC family dehydratase N-terminal domain-containing protein [Deltaproteobacteria bacterium]MBW2385767.1 MaoC family dehydratase N-terminal domain-containing protein [Deltaproteobacteria bacterium]MBW2694862.1 MaoC family dehydratase N-terminal domain-containing protein [Deltaproteobacteria bacterium]
MRYFEDYEVGELRHIGSYEVSRDEIVEFARRFDPQPFHIDEAAARESIFGGLTGSSCYTFALMSLIHSRCDEQSALVANLGAESLRFPSPLRPDDEITLSTECTALRASKTRPGIGIVTTRSFLTNQRDETVMEMTTNFMVKRRDEWGR